MYHLILDMEMDIAERLEEAKKHDEEIEKKAAEKAKKETVFSKKFSFGTLLLMTMVIGPIMDGIIVLTIWKAFF